MGKPGSSIPYREALEEHRRLREMNAQLIEFLEQPRPEPDDPAAHEWASTLSARLVALHRQVSLHFRDEDGAGVLSKLAVRYPWASNRLEALRNEHDSIAGDLQEIVSASMAYAEAKTPDDPRLRSRTRDLLEAIKRHESEETSLIQELVSTDVGAGD